MTVVIDKSVCKDCYGVETCQRLKRLNPVYENVGIGDSEDREVIATHERQKEVFDIIIVNCSQKSRYDWQKEKDTHFCFTNKIDIVKPKDLDKDNTLYYCNLCKAMHRESSKIGLEHKEWGKINDGQRQENSKDGMEKT